MNNLQLGDKLKCVDNKGCAFENGAEYTVELLETVVGPITALYSDNGGWIHAGALLMNGDGEYSCKEWDSPIFINVEEKEESVESSWVAEFDDLNSIKGVECKLLKSEKRYLVIYKEKSLVVISSDLEEVVDVLNAMGVDVEYKKVVHQINNGDEFIVLLRDLANKNISFDFERLVFITDDGDMDIEVFEEEFGFKINIEF